MTTSGTTKLYRSVIHGEYDSGTAANMIEAMHMALVTIANIGSGAAQQAALEALRAVDAHAEVASAVRETVFGGAAGGGMSACNYDGPGRPPCGSTDCCEAAKA